MARHMKAASCRLLRSHAAVDGTPHRLMVPHRAPRPSAALPRQQEANFLPTVAFCAAISTNFQNRCATLFLHPQATQAAPKR